MGKLQAMMDMAKLKVRANSPTICLVAGVITSAAAIGFTAWAGIKTPSILEQRKAEVEEIENTRDSEDKDFEYTEDDAEHDIKRANKKCILELMKIYAPAAALYSASLVLFITGNKILEKRNTALATALNSTQAFLAGYRERVASYLGKDKEEQVYRGMYKKSEIDPETGELHEEELVDETVNHIFERVYDNSCKNWADEQWTNQSVLFDTEKFLNTRLQERAMYNGIGVVTLNEVLSYIGLPGCPEGMILGWWYDDTHRSVIDFGITGDTRNNAFVNGLDKTCHLTFNVDGDVMTILKKNGITEMVNLR